MAFVVIAILLGIFVAFSITQLSTAEPWEDYSSIRGHYERWTIADIGKGFDIHVKWLLLSTSMHIFGNDKIIPFFASIALLVLIYLTTVELTKKRFAGIVSMIIVLQSNIFLTYDTSPTYENFWILFYLFSIYSIFKSWPLSPVSYVLAIFSKALTAIFFPMTLFFVYRLDIPRKKKMVIALSYGIIILLFAIGFLAGAKVVNQGLREFNSHDFWSGFSAFSFELRYDPLVVVSLLPLSIGLLIASRKGVPYADSIMFFVASLLFLPSLLVSLTPYGNEPYRFLPLIVFFAIGVGLLLSKRISQLAPA